MDPAQIAEQLSSFWNEYWQRDTEEEQTNLDHWPSFLDMSRTLPVIDPIQQDFEDLELWKESLRHMKSKGARGFCAWAPDELKDLPDVALKDLQTIFLHHLTQGFPEHLMGAFAVPLQKQVGVHKPSNTRPITVTSLIYRYWVLGDQHYLPEGDPMAVAAMVAVNYLWVHHMPDRVSPTAYADNWAYCTQFPREHKFALAVLLRVTRALKLTVDWQKTWGWGTSKAHKHALQSAKQTQTGNALKLATVTHARDLGFIAHYRLHPYRAPQKARHTAALARLKRLQHSQLPIHHRAHVAKMSAITKALWGVHLYGGGQQYFNQLRTGVAKALLGSHRNVQSHLANTVLSSASQDPEHYVILQALKQARSFLVKADATQRSLFLHIARIPNKRVGHAIGPASALQVYLAKVGWSVDQQGCLHTTDVRDLHLWHSPQEDILLALERAWMDQVSLSLSTRKGLRNVPIIDRQATNRAFAQVPQASQKTLGIQMTNGFMLAKQKKKFLTHQQDRCPLCAEPDSYEHQLLHCEALAEARAPFQDLCSRLSELNPVHLQLPLKFVDPQQDWLDAVQTRLPEASLSLPDFEVDKLYTDAACKHPTSHHGRWVTYAVVALRPGDPCPHMDIDAILNTMGYALGAAHVHGRQNVPRGELLATVCAHELCLGVVVVTDSSYAVSCHELVKATRDVTALHDRRNFDLLRRLHSLHWDRQQPLRVQKIKSHQPLPSVGSSIFRDVLGNMLADKVASAAHSNLTPSLLQQCAQVRTEHQAMQALLTDQLTLRQRLAEVRVKLLQAAEDRQDHSGTVDLQEWTVHDAWAFVPPADVDDALCASRYGVQHSYSVVQWLTTLGWPTAEDARLPIGITWHELAVNYMIVTGRSLPVNTGTLRDPVFLCREESPLLDDTVYTFDTQVNAFRHSVEHLEYLLDVPVLPQVGRQRVRSLTLLCGGQIKNGIPARPQMRHQSATVTAVRDYFLHLQDSGADTTFFKPLIPMVETIRVVPMTMPVDNSVQARSARYHQRRMVLRTRRNHQRGEGT
eukprot:Skav235503  [mRNA]  locus=scaffold625:62387:65766:- [translate_table: standard]